MIPWLRMREQLQYKQTGEQHRDGNPEMNVGQNPRDAVHRVTIAIHDGKALYSGPPSTVLFSKLFTTTENSELRLGRRHASVSE
jgi:hypothetical protein